MKKMRKIIICAVAGAAAGGAANLAFACDFIFAADDAKFLQAFVGIGLCPDTGGVYFLPAWWEATGPSICSSPAAR